MNASVAGSFPHDETNPDLTDDIVHLLAEDPDMMASLISFNERFADAGDFFCDGEKGQPSPAGAPAATGAAGAGATPVVAAPGSVAPALGDAAAVAGQKRSREAVEERSQRKKVREKMRRQELKDKLEELISILNKLDDKGNDQCDARQSTRVEILGRTVSALSKLQARVASKQREINNLRLMVQTLTVDMARIAAENAKHQSAPMHPPRHATPAPGPIPGHFPAGVPSQYPPVPPPMAPSASAPAPPPFPAQYQPQPGNAAATAAFNAGYWAATAAAASAEAAGSGEGGAEGGAGAQAAPPLLSIASSDAKESDAQMEQKVNVEQLQQQQQMQQQMQPSAPLAPWAFAPGMAAPVQPNLPAVPWPMPQAGQPAVWPLWGTPGQGAAPPQAQGPQRSAPPAQGPPAVAAWEQADSSKVARDSVAEETAEETHAPCA